MVTAYLVRHKIWFKVTVGRPVCLVHDLDLKARMYYPNFIE